MVCELYLNKAFFKNKKQVGKQENIRTRFIMMDNWGEKKKEDVYDRTAKVDTSYKILVFHYVIDPQIFIIKSKQTNIQQRNTE